MMDKGKDLTDKERYLLRLKAEEETNRLNRLKRVEKAKNIEQRKQQYLTQLQEHSTGNITWKHSVNGWDGYYNNERYFTARQGLYKYSLAVNTSIRNSYSDLTKKLTTSYDLKKVQAAAESMMGSILAEMERRKNRGTEGQSSI